jgi:hypothetical protein
MLARAREGPAVRPRTFKQGRDVIHANRRLGYFPQPDAYGRAGNGRRAPLWKRSTVWAFANNRERGSGRTPGIPGRPRDRTLTRVDRYRFRRHHIKWHDGL